MEQLDHLASDADRALSRIGRIGECGDDRFGAGDLVLGGREGAIARFDLRGVDQRLTVEAERPALRSSRATGKTKKTSHQKENTE